MNLSIKSKSLIYLITAVTFAVSSCKKENSAVSGNTDTPSPSSTISVAATNSTSAGSASTDSVYIVQLCGRGEVRDSIAASALPAGITAYLTTNYPGFTFKKEYSIKSSTGIITGYVAVIYFNDKPVGVLFDSNGNFVKVLEQREKGDLDGKGWHHGGRFEDRDGIKKDTVALSVLPSAITAYLANTFTTDTLLKAFTNRDSSYIIISKNNGLFATLFDNKGNFIKRVALHSKQVIYQIRDITDLSASITSYLGTAYPNYTIKRAYSLLLNGTVQAYIIIIDANSTRYALEFDSSGMFVRVKTLF